MKWQVCTPEPGDIVRVKLSEIYHYGIYVSDDEVIQFGLPPNASRHIDDADVEVLSTDIDRFRCNGFPETAVLSVTERMKRYSPRKTVRIARERIGEKGYHLLSNNCEHFVYECVFGTKYCSQTDDVREAIRNLPLVDVYLCNISLKEGECLGNWAQCFVEYCLERSFGIKTKTDILSDVSQYDSRVGGYYVSYRNCQETAVCAVSRKGAVFACEMGYDREGDTGYMKESDVSVREIAEKRFCSLVPDNSVRSVSEKSFDDLGFTIALCCARGSLIRYYAVQYHDGSFGSKLMK